MYHPKFDVSPTIIENPSPTHQPRADMFLPKWLLIFGIVLLIGGVVLLFFFIPAALFCLVLGAAAVLCWKNQTIRIISDSTFVYTTFLGRQHEYRFSQIEGLRQNSDSMTLFVGGGKVHIESCARLTQRLLDKLEAHLPDEA